MYRRPSQSLTILTLLGGFSGLRLVYTGWQVWSVTGYDFGLLLVETAAGVEAAEYIAHFSCFLWLDGFFFFLEV